MFLGIPDIDREILHWLDDDILYIVIRVNKYAQSICNNIFWIERFTNKFGMSLVEYGADHRSAYKATKGFSFEQLMNYSAARGYLNMIKHLEHHTDIRASNEWVLRLASRMGHLPIVEYCVQVERHDRYVEYLALTEALKYDRIEVSTFLLNRVTLVPVLYRYPVKNNSRLLDMMIAKNGYSSLIITPNVTKDLCIIALFAVEYRNMDMLERIIGISDTVLDHLFYYTFPNKGFIAYLANSKYAKYLLRDALKNCDYYAVETALKSKRLSLEDLTETRDNLTYSTSPLLQLKINNAINELLEQSSTIISTVQS